MKVKRRLFELARAISDEAERNPVFAKKLGDVLGLENRRQEKSSSRPKVAGRPKNRRPPAAFDPVAVIRESGEDELRSRLSNLSLEQLRDIVADYGMDPGKQVMKWKDSNRVISRILEISLTRSHKGDAFRAT